MSKVNGHESTETKVFRAFLEKGDERKMLEQTPNGSEKLFETISAMRGNMSKHSQMSDSD
jgi:hypothetical protein